MCSWGRWYLTDAVIVRQFRDRQTTQRFQLQLLPFLFLFLIRETSVQHRVECFPVGQPQRPTNRATDNQKPPGKGELESKSLVAFVLVASSVLLRHWRSSRSTAWRCSLETRTCRPGASREPRPIRIPHWHHLAWRQGPSALPLAVGISSTSPTSWETHTPISDPDSRKWCVFVYIAFPYSGTVSKPS